MSVWDWIDNYFNNLPPTASEIETRMMTPFMTARDFFETAPDQALMHLEQGKQWGNQINHAWWEMFYEHWILQVTLFYKKDYITGIDRAVKAAVEVRKPTYISLPQRICIHEDLISAYVGIDSDGYEEDVLKAIDYMQTQVNAQLECRFCVQGLRVNFAIMQERYDEAIRELAHYDNMSEGDSHYTADALLAHARLAYTQKNWVRLLEVSKEGEPLARTIDRPLWLLEFLAWQGLALQHLGDPQAARRVILTALMREKRYNANPSDAFWTALTAYYEADGQLETALAERQRELSRLVGTGQNSDEARCRIQIVRLKKRLGQPYQEEQAAAQAAVNRLIKPQRCQATLDETLQSS